MSYKGRKINIIVAVDENWAIGYKNKLLISIPEDMKFFMQMTTGGVCIMGKGTLESLPAGKPLKNRVNIVLTRDKTFKENGADIVHSVEEALEKMMERKKTGEFTVTEDREIPLKRDASFCL